MTSFENYHVVAIFEKENMTISGLPERLNLDLFLHIPCGHYVPQYSL